MDHAAIQSDPKVETKSDPNERIHSLLQPVVLGKTFEYLRDDMGSLLSCRRVHPEWTKSITSTNPDSFPFSIKTPRNVDEFSIEQPLYSSSNVETLRELLSSEDCTVPCENLTIGKGLELTNVAILSFIEDYGIHLRRLDIQQRVTTLSVLIALQECPNLQHLEIDPMGIENLDIPESFQETWNNSLPQLKSLTLHSTHKEFTVWDGHYDSLRRRGVNLADVGYEMPFDFVILLLTKIPTIGTLKVKNYYLPLWNEIFPRLTQRPKLLQQLTNVHLNFHYLLFYDNRLENILAPELNVKVLEIRNFSRIANLLLENVSHTLEILTLQKGRKRLHFGPEVDSPPPVITKRSNKHLKFRNEMMELKKIIIYSTSYALIDCSGEGNRSLFEQLPKLRSFKTLEGEDVDHMWKFKTERDAWEKMFPHSPASLQFVHNGIGEFCVDWVLPDQDFLLRIKRSFPQLRTLGLTVEGSMLQSLASELIDLPIYELDINYGESEKGIEEFAAGISGLSVLDCEQYVNCSEKVEKVRLSFADWKSLRALKIRYIGSKQHFENDGGFVPVTNVCVNCGFGTMRQLQRITLKGFEIHPIQVASILNKVALFTFDLGESMMNDWGWIGTPESLREANEAAIQGIRAKFPCVGLRVANL